jgi:predicted kinase
LDGTFADPAWRDRVYALAHNHGARVIVLRTCCEDEAYIRARLWRRRLDHSRSEHEVTRFENFSLTYAEVTESPVEADRALAEESVDLVTFDNNGDRAVRTSVGASVDAEMIAELIRISPLMSSSI